MVSPDDFAYNPQTAESNLFQREMDLDAEEIKRRALDEFKRMVKGLEELGVDVVVVDDDPLNKTPDAVFPNNVFSSHEDGTVCVYPMEAPARRLERSILTDVFGKVGRKRVFDLTRFESKGKYLEGTGSMVLDRQNRIAFACLSTRTHREVLKLWCDEMGYEEFAFTAVDGSGKKIYHTNVMMCLGVGFAVACVESIADPKEKANFGQRIHQTERELIGISQDQMSNFAGNMLEIANKSGERLLLMSETARASLSEKQIERLSSHSRIVAFDIETIEACGGGSVRCMIAELY